MKDLQRTSSMIDLERNLKSLKDQIVKQTLELELQSKKHDKEMLGKNSQIEKLN